MCFTATCFFLSCERDKEKKEVKSGTQFEQKKVKLLMQAPPTDPLYDASHQDESTKKNLIDYIEP